MKIQVLFGVQLPLDSLIAQIIHYLTIAWGLILFIGNFIASMLIALGVIFWLSGWKLSRGRQMVLGGIILFLVMLWMAWNAPWIAFLS